MLGGHAVPSLQLDLLKMIYEYSYLIGREGAGVPLSVEESLYVSALRRRLEPRTAERRSHTRQIAALPVLLKGPSGVRSGFVRNLSGGGMLIECGDALIPGSQIHARLGSAGETEYIFSCTVVRQENAYAGLRFDGIPLEIRYGSYRRTLERTDAVSTISSR